MAIMGDAPAMDPSAKFLQETIAELRAKLATAEEGLKDSSIALERARSAHEQAEHTYSRLSSAVHSITGEDEMVKAMPADSYDNSPRRGGY